MDSKPKTSWILALIGTILVWFPIAAMLLTSLVGSIQSGQFRMDTLMPAELFLSVLIGGGLLLWAAFRSKHLKLPIVLTFCAAILLPLGAQGLAMLTGLADGRIGMDSGWFIVVATSLGLYILAEIALGILGVLLLGKMKRSVPSS